jgi:murein tripeptide amidase MpaA
MAEWAAEGLLRRLIDEHDATSRALLRQAVFYVVPNMCPDGSARGHLRTNAAGANLNREWAQPAADRSPEVPRGGRAQRTRYARTRARGADRV